MLQDFALPFFSPTGLHTENWLLSRRFTQLHVVAAISQNDAFAFKLKFHRFEIPWQTVFPGELAHPKTGKLKFDKNAVFRQPSTMQHYLFRIEED
ncbi:MAG: hypothetical protein WC091_14100 [Sulfuricellaceae bacterium]